MDKRFARFKARDYEFKNDDGSTDRHVIVLYAGGKRIGLMEYEHAYAFVHKIHDLAEAHEKSEQGGEPND